MNKNFPDPDHIRDKAIVDNSEFNGHNMDLGPAPDAPGPEALHGELENHLIAHAGISKNKAEKLVQGLLAIQMAYYERLATPAMTEDVIHVQGVVDDVRFAAENIIRAGAALSSHLGTASPVERAHWQQAALKLRETTSALGGLLA